ncbi:MAG TPA: M1 family aminopeptidase, partial [Bacteroidia bacterium]
QSAHVQSVPQSHVALENKYDVKFNHLDINVERINKNISGNVRTISKVVAPTLNVYALELYSTMVIDSARINGDLLTPARAGDAVTYTLPSTLNQNDIIDATIYYHGTPPSGSDAGMSNGTSGSWGNQVTWTLSEPYAAHEWWPCKQQLQDKSDSSYVYVTTDSTNKAGSNGILKNVTTIGDKKRYEWHNIHTIDYYLISIAVAKYVDYSIYAHPAGITDSVLIQNYVYDNPATLTNFQSVIDQTADLIEYFSDIYGLYPFWDQKYGHAMAPFSGGMEHQTMTSLGFFDFSLIAHELGHQWWGDNVTCRTWNDIWVNEGFASYSEHLALEHFDPANAPANMSQVHTSVMSQNGGSVYNPDTTDINRIFSSRLSYDKGCAIVHSLRFVINNDNLFFTVLKNYQNQFQNGTASINDFQSVAETTTSLDLDQFFDQWIFGEGYPTFTVRWNQVGNTFILKNTETVSMSGVTPLFITPLEYKLTRSIGDTIIKLDQSQAIENYSFTVGGTVTNVTTDPNNWILNKGTVTKDVNLVGLDEKEVLASSIHLFPNPAFEEIMISAPSDKALRYNLIDITGKTLASGPINAHSNKIQVSELVEGMYFVELSTITEGHIKTIKFVKQ